MLYSEEFDVLFQSASECVLKTSAVEQILLSSKAMLKGMNCLV